MKLLFDNNLAPVTSTLCFVEASPSDAAEAFISFMREHYAAHQRNKKISLTQHKVKGNLKQVLLSLEPLTGTDSKRYLFVPTQTAWTAYFDNGVAGSDIHDFRIAALGILSSRLLTTIARPALDLYRGDVIGMELYTSDQQEPLPLGLRRSILLTHDDMKWEFNNYGSPFDFEDSQRYIARRKKDRFTFEMLYNYLKQFGVSAFNEDFYMPEGSEAVLVEKHGNLDITAELSIIEAGKLKLS